MIVLDTDTLTHYFNGHPRVLQRVEAATETPLTSVVSRIEVLQGRFASLLKAADAEQLLLAQHRLRIAERDLAKFAIVPIDELAAALFDSLRREKKLKKTGRNDLLIACIALAHRATLVTCNTKDFQAVPGLKLENWTV